jgi:O-6-methylguanine DNA methyltransferase
MKFIGVDGCKAGWFYVSIDDGHTWEIGVLKNINDISIFLPNCQLILIDIPIGLTSCSVDERLCDKEARAVLRAPRSSSVFPVPSRIALKAKTYAMASTLNARVTGRKLSRQSWAIAPKIKEVDEFLKNIKNRHKIREMHPEVCFWGLNNYSSMQHNKRRQAGFLERKKLLGKFFQHTDELVEQAMKTFCRKELAKDDVLDALAGAITASFHDSLATLPETTEVDANNLPMEVVYAQVVADQRTTKPPLLWTDAANGLEDSAVIMTAAGKFAVYTQGHVIIKAEWVMDNSLERQPESKFLRNVIMQLKQYWQNPDMAFVLPMLKQGTEFQRQVWQVLADIPYKSTASYNDIARKLKSGPRAVGGACRKNPFPVFIPCHRVVAANGIGGYAGSTEGELLKIKKLLLAHEGVI